MPVHKRSQNTIEAMRSLIGLYDSVNNFKNLLNKTFDHRTPGYTELIAALNNAQEKLQDL